METLNITTQPCFWPLTSNLQSSVSVGDGVGHCSRMSTIGIEIITCIDLQELKVTIRLLLN